MGPSKINISDKLRATWKVRKFSKRPRGYMLAYWALECDVMKESTNRQTDISHRMIEKMKKVISSHRAAFHFDRGYLNKIVTGEGFDLVAKVKPERNSSSKKGRRKIQN